MTEEILSGLAVRVTPDNWETLKLLRSSIPAKPYVVYRIARDNFIAVTDLIGSEKLIPSFDKLDEFISVYITHENKEELLELVGINKWKKDSILVSYNPNSNDFRTYNSLLGSETSNEELLVDSFDNLEDIKILVSLGLSRIEISRILQEKPSD